jgi:hypothetical protein
MYVYGMGHKTSPCTATFNDLLYGFMYYKMDGVWASTEIHMQIGFGEAEFIAETVNLRICMT